MESANQTNQPAYTSYDQIPWYRKNWFALVCGLFFSPGLLPSILTGNIYYQKKGEIAQYSKFARGALIVWCLVGTVTITAKVFEGTGSGLPEEISGVWRENGTNTLIVLNSLSKDIQMAVDGIAVPVSLSDIDKQNGIVNLNAVDRQGNTMIWTIRQVWNEKHEGFNLSITMHDGTQSDLIFVRKPSSADLAVFSQQQQAVQSQPEAQSAQTQAASPAPVQEASTGTEKTFEGTIDAGTDLSNVSTESGEGYTFETNSAAGNAIFQNCKIGVRCHIVAVVDGESIISVKSAAAVE